MPKLTLARTVGQSLVLRVRGTECRVTLVDIQRKRIPSERFLLRKVAELRSEFIQPADKRGQGQDFNLRDGCLDGCGSEGFDLEVGTVLVRITIIEIEGNRLARIGIDAPREVVVLRSELITSS